MGAAGAAGAAARHVLVTHADGRQTVEPLAAPPRGRADALAALRRAGHAPVEVEVFGADEAEDADDERGAAVSIARNPALAHHRTRERRVESQWLGDLRATSVGWVGGPSAGTWH